MLPISDRLGSYLKSWHKTSTTRQMGKGRVVELTYTDFLSLFTPGQLMGLEWAIQNDTLRQLQNEKSSEALVLTWRGYEAVASGHFNTRTAMICSRKTTYLTAMMQLIADRMGMRRGFERSKNGALQSKAEFKARD